MLVFGNFSSFPLSFLQEPWFFSRKSFTHTGKRQFTTKRGENVLFSRNEVSSLLFPWKSLISTHTHFLRQNKTEKDGFYSITRICQKVTKVKFLRVKKIGYLSQSFKTLTNHIDSKWRLWYKLKCLLLHSIVKKLDMMHSLNSKIKKLLFFTRYPWSCAIVKNLSNYIWQSTKNILSRTF